MTNKSFLELWLVKVDVPKLLVCGQLCRGTEAGADHVHDHRSSPAAGRETPRYEDCAMGIQNGCGGLILVQRTPRESPNKRTC